MAIAENSPSEHALRPSYGLLYLFIFLNLALRIALLRLNTGEYTDGILQLLPPASGRAAGLYPPLFGWLARLVSHAGLNLETSGRLISAVAGTLTLPPLFYLTRRFFSEDAARLSAVFFTISPMLMRWSLHAMTDSLFTCLSTWGLYFLITAWASIRSSTWNSRIGWRLAISIGICAAAAVVRYQGIVLAVIQCVAVVSIGIRIRRIPWLALAALLLWAFPAYWYISHGRVHSGQFLNRTSINFWTTAAAYWNTLESFVLIAPYYFGYPVTLFAAIGLVYLPAARSEIVAPYILIVTLLSALLLVIHSAFGSFQYRYMMPVLPWLFILAGHGAHQLYILAAAKKWYPAYSVLFIMAVIYLCLFTCGVLILQRQSFGDQKEAAKYVVSKATKQELFFGNERYGAFTELGCVKLSFWSGRRVNYIVDEATGSLKSLPAGSWVFIGDHYGGAEMADAILAQIRQTYRVEEQSDSTFVSQIIPLMDDIMPQPLFNQNPLAWVLRYTPQTFRTRVIHIVAPQATP